MLPGSNKKKLKDILCRGATSANTNSHKPLLQRHEEEILPVSEKTQISKIL